MTSILNDEYYMKQALAEAQIAFQKGEIPVGAIIVCKDKIIARAHNFTETLNDVTAHAEILAITSAANILGGKYLKDCILYVTLEPCPMCAGALLWSQVSKIVYGASDSKKGFSQYSPLIQHPKTTVVSGILEDECSILMKNFFKLAR